MNKKIVYGRRFVKHYKKRIQGNTKLEQRLKERVEIFQYNPSNPLLQDHGLTGGLIGKRSFSITGDYRIVYEVYPDHFRFIDIGTHAQVYGK